MGFRLLVGIGLVVGIGERFEFESAGKHGTFVDGPAYGGFP